MMTKHFIILFGLVAVCCAGIVPAAVPYTVGTYATSYNAHAINHVYASPLVAAPAVPAAVAAPPLAYSSPLTYPAFSAYSPYAAYHSPIIAARR